MMGCDSFHGMARSDRPTRSARRAGKVAAALDSQRQQLSAWLDEHDGQGPEAPTEPIADPEQALVRLVADCDASEVPLQPTALATAVRLLADQLATAHPGQSLEVRVPPFAAIQCDPSGTGPTHTRGTPPNVVETDPRTFLRLATGRLTWDAARTAGLVSASGIRADLTDLLPLLPRR